MNNTEILKDVTLLYVEDDKEVNEALTRSLRRICKEVFVAYNGLEGFELFEQHKDKIDIIVTDIKMPILDGIGMIKKIRQIDSLKPIIITSAHGESEYLYEAIDEGVASYILKPISKQRLKETLIFTAKASLYDMFEQRVVDSIEKLLELPDNAAILFKHHHIVKASDKVLKMFGCKDVQELDNHTKNILNSLVSGTISLEEGEYKLFGQNINGSMVLIYFQD
ncbi:MAG: response regulator transcription factor [Campylobacterota bacterium]